MKVSTKLAQLLSLPIVTMLCLLFLSCSSAPVAGKNTTDAVSPVEQTNQVYLPLVAVSAPEASANISGFGEVRLLSVVNRAVWQGENAFIVAATVFTDTNPEISALPGNFALARYFADGTLDRSFGDNGSVATHFVDRSVDARDLVLQSDGKIVVIGNATTGTYLNPDSEIEFALARYEANGTLDPTFNSDGRLLLDVVTGSHDMVNSIAFQADGKTLLAGRTFNPNTTDWEATVKSDNSVMVRLTSDGRLDNSFADHGKQIMDFGGTEGAVDIVNFNNQRIVTVGNYCCFDLTKGTSGISLSQTDENGVIDRAFGTQGQFVTQFSEKQYVAARAVMQLDSKLLVAGYLNSSAFMQWVLVRYLPDGSLDTWFGEDGKVVTNLGTDEQGFYSDYQFINDTLIQPDGKIVVAGGASSIHGGCRCRTIIARYNPDGSLDNSFDGDGILSDDFSELGDESAMALLFTLDNKILMIGQASEYSGPKHLTLARYNSDGSQDKTFSVQQSHTATETYISSAHGFSLTHPAAWQVEESDANLGNFGKKVSWLITTVDPLICRGDCPATAEVIDVEIAGKPAKKVLGHYAGVIGDMGFQEYLQYIVQEGDHYLVMTLFAVNAKGMPGVINGEIVPLNTEDVARFEEMMETLRFGD